MNLREHWERAYAEKDPADTSWFQTRPELSLRLIAASGVGKSDGVIDVGGGASPLVDCLVDAGFDPVAVLDISGAALKHARRRLGSRAAAVNWFEADVTDFVSPRRFGLWHDRAVFHFLTDAEDRRAYLETLRRALAPGGTVIIATFARHGPTRCSGLPVERYDASSMCAQLSPEFSLIEEASEVHRTPWNAEQPFVYFRFRMNTDA
jgi:SAM-dependent methyltransferase